MPRKGARGRGGNKGAASGGRGRGAATTVAEAPGSFSQELPGKEQGIFKSVLRYYESKQFKRGIKMADSILKKYPHNGETLAMKGLILNGQDKKEEAYTLVKQGLKYNLKSHVCWHVYGLLHRSHSNYLESIKCYQQALRLDKTNGQILRDLSSLQIQTRSYEGFKETRRQMLTNKSSNYSNWMAFAFSAHVASDYALALSVMNSYKAFLDEDRKKDKEKKRLAKQKKPSGILALQQTKDKLKLKHEKRKGLLHEDDPKEEEEAVKTIEEIDEELFGDLEFDYSEMCLYKNLILEDIGDIGEALNDINAIEPYVMDRYCLQEKRALFLLKLGRLEESEKQYRYLLSCNGENYDYHRGYQQAAGFLPAEETQDATTVRDCGKMGPSQKHVVKIAGSCTTNTTTSAVPSVTYFCIVSYDHLKQEDIDRLDKFYQETGKTYARYPDSFRRLPLEFLNGERFKEAFLDYVKPKLKKGVPSLYNSVRSLYRSAEKARVIEELMLNTLKSLETSNTFFNSEEEGEPSTILWLYYYLANHYNALGNHTEAMSFIEKAIEHTPTVVDLYVCKGRIYKHAGDPQNAAYWGNYGRELDLADRYLNVKCAKLLLRADEPEKAETVAVLFTKDGDTTLHDMQAMWYELECGDSYRRLKKEHLALKNYATVIKHFEEIDEDQMDFHVYALRKMTARAYLSMIQMEDSLRSHQNYLRSTVGMVELYLERHDNPPAKISEEDELASLTPAERKRFMQKKRKLAAKEEAAAAAVTAAAVAKAKKTGKKVDKDPLGMKLLEVEDPLQEALKRYRVVEHQCRDRILTHSTGFEVYFRLKKVLLMLRCIKRARALNERDPAVLRMCVKFFHLIDTQHAALDVHDTVMKVIEVEREGIVASASLAEFVEAYLKSAASLEELFAGIEMKAYLNPTAEEKKKGAESLKEHLANPQYLSLDTHIKACEYIKKSVSAEAADEAVGLCAKKFPFSLHFNPNIPLPVIELGKNTFSRLEEEPEKIEEKKE